MKNRDIYWRYKIQETYIKQWCLRSLQSRHLGTSHSSPSISSIVQNSLQNPLLESPSAALFWQYSWISSMVWNLLFFKGDFSFGKSQKSQGTRSGLYGGWVTWATNLCWLQPVHIQHSQVFCLLQAFFQQIIGHLWSICATLLFDLHSSHHPQKPSESS